MMPVNRGLGSMFAGNLDESKPFTRLTHPRGRRLVGAKSRQCVHEGQNRCRTSTDRPAVRTTSLTAGGKAPMRRPVQGRVMALRSKVVTRGPRPGKRRSRGQPLDIEVVRVLARRTVPQQVPPPWVLASGGGHVVGHDVHHQLQPVLAQCSDEPPRSSLTRVGSTTFVPVATATRGLKDW
jgi:hypothetical protein